MTGYQGSATKGNNDWFDLTPAQIAEASDRHIRKWQKIGKIVIACALVASPLMHGGKLAAQIQQPIENIESPAESDPQVMGWMQGSPPPEDKRIIFADGSTLKFPKTRWVFSHYRELVPTTRVSSGPRRPSELPLALRDSLDHVMFTPSGQRVQMSWGDAFKQVYGDGILVLHRGNIVYERYAGALDRDTTHAAFSVTKSFIGILVEMLIAEHKVNENERVSYYIPELSGSGFGDATVRQILDMTTGLDYTEDYADPNSRVVEYGMATGVMPRPANYSGPANMFDFLKTIGKSGEHGEEFSYKSVNTEVLGVLIARTTGKKLQDVLSERIWSKLGTDHDADLIIDPTGMPLAAGGLNLSLRDMARFGEMMRLGGRFNGQQIVPASIVNNIRKGASQVNFAKAGYITLPGWSYRSQWWVSHNLDGAYTARGVFGQTIYIDPKAEMVVVRFASNPIAANASFDPISLPAYQAMADELMQSVG